MPAKRPSPRLPILDETQMSDAQRALLDAIRSGPRGKSVTPRGPFAVWLHAPEFGHLAQALGGHCRYKTALSRGCRNSPSCARRAYGGAVRMVRPRAHGRKGRREDEDDRDLRAGREPKSAPKDERAIYAFVRELYKTSRVSDRTYKRVHAFLGDAATVELVGILGYYVMISMTLNVFRMMPPADTELAFAER